jgi:predicted O-methyltransferase YrrM
MDRHHSEFILFYFKFFNYASYLELGLYCGETICKIKTVTNNVTGVDIVDRFIEGIDFFNGTTDDFFKQNSKTFDMIFIDADHSYNSVKNDLLDSLLILNKNGTIFLHDTDPENATLLQSGYCGDCYKIVDYMNNLGCISVVTMPVAEAGLTMVKRKSDRRVLSFTGDNA